MVRILSVVALLCWSIPAIAQPSVADDVQILPGIDQETLIRLSAQLQKNQQQSATLDKFRNLWDNGDGQGIKELYDEMQSSPEGRQMLQDIIQQGQQDPQTAAQLKQLVEINRDRFQRGEGRFPSRPPAEMRMPNRPRRHPEFPERPRFPNDTPSPKIDLPDGTSGGIIPNENPPPGEFRLPDPIQSESSPGNAAANSAKAKQYKAVTRFFEKNFGSLDNSPAVRGLIRDIFMSEKLDPSGEGFDNMATGNAGNLFEDVAMDFGQIDFKIGGFDFGSLNLGGFEGSSSSSSSSGSSSSRWSSSSGGSFTGGDSWWSVGIFMAVLVAGLLLWWMWPMLKGHAHRNGTPKPLAGQGPWPIDPRSIHDRPTLVKAFDYIASSLYGDDASAWNHQTIAEKIRQTYAHTSINSEQLASIYAEARYRPVDEELAQGAISSARVSLCKLAGVPA